MGWIRISVIGLVLFASVVAQANTDGFYTCKNLEGLPDNTYKISTMSVGAGGQSLPFIEASRFFREVPADRNSPIKESRLKGFASVSQMDTTIYMMVAALRLEFRADKLLGCERQ